MNRFHLQLLFPLLLLPLACREEASTTTRPSATADGSASTPDDTRTIASTDARDTGNVLPREDRNDDPETPHVIPKTDQLVGWTKIKAARMRAPGLMDQLVTDDRLREFAQLYPLERVGHAVYRSSDSIAELLYFEAESPLDAYGLFSVATGSRGEFNRADGSIRTREPTPDGALYAAWQGDATILVRCRTGVVDGAMSRPASENTPGTLPDCDAVLKKVVFEIPGSDPPFLMMSIPPEVRERCRVWVVRSTKALMMLDPPLLTAIPSDVLDLRFGLDGDAILQVAEIQIDSEGEKEANLHRRVLIWFVEYPDEDAALAAARRYREAMADSQIPLDRHTRVLDAQGRCVPGTWTAGSGEVEDLLVMLRELLATL